MFRPVTFKLECGRGCVEGIPLATGAEDMSCLGKSLEKHVVPKDPFRIEGVCWDGLSLAGVH